MRTLLAVCALALGACPGSALAQGPADGSDQAPAGVPQRPKALDGYPTRPPWKVAGVDYPVGIPAGTSLRSPTSIHLAGVSVQPASKYVGVSGNNVVLDSYDFSGWQVELLAGATNLTIERSKFFAAPTQKLSPVYAQRGGTVTLIYDTIDGGGPASAANPLFTAGTGGAVIAYNLFTHVPDDAINITHDGVFTIQFNLFDALNYGEGHTDCVQTFFSALTSLKVDYNTVYQPPPESSGFPGGGNSFARIGDERGNTVKALEIAHNTLVFRGEKDARFANVFDISADGGAVLNPTVHDNFVDPTGILYGIWSPYESDLTSPVYYGNRDLSTGGPLLASRYNSRTAGVPARSPSPPEITGASRDAAHVTVTGTAPPNTTVSLVADAGPLGAATAGAKGTWTIVAALPPSTLVVAARATDPWGNASAATSVRLANPGTQGR